MEEDDKPKRWGDKSISLHPLSFDEALKKLLKAKPEKRKKKKKKGDEEDKASNDRMG